jgi:flagellar protein FliO/FliZ
VDTFLLALRVVVSLGVVIGAIWFVQRRVSRSGGGSKTKRAGKPMSVIARQNLGPKASVAVVDFGGKRFLLGVTEHGIAVLDGTEAEADEPVVVAEPAAIAAPVERVAPVAITRRASSKQNSRDFALALGQAAVEAPTPAAATAPATSLATAAPRPAGVRLAKPEQFNGMFPQGSSKMAGSILSAATWKQAWIAVRGRS